MSVMRGAEPVTRPSTLAKARRDLAEQEADPFAHEDGSKHQRFGPKTCPRCTAKRQEYSLSVPTPKRAAGGRRKKA